MKNLFELRIKFGVWGAMVPLLLFIATDALMKANLGLFFLAFIATVMCIAELQTTWHAVRLEETLRLLSSSELTIRRRNPDGSTDIWKTTIGAASHNTTSPKEDKTDG